MTLEKYNMTIESFETYEVFKIQIDSMGPFEFEEFVYKLFVRTGSYIDVQHNQVINGRQIDVGLYEKSTNLISQRVYWAVEVKSYKSKVPVQVVDAFYSKLIDIKELEPNSNLLVVSTNGFTRSAVSIAKNRGIHLWGPRELFALYQNKKTDFSETTPEDDVDHAIESKVKAFKRMLKDIEPGTDGWSKYQQLVFEILEFLFCPPLENPQFELADKDKRNRRDFIFENSTNDGFWKIIRETYEGHYIVIDAKNYAKPLAKRPILDISHYLKPYGCGLFAIIVSRKGIDGAAEHAVKEQWIGSKKMIISFSDEDLTKMLDWKLTGIPVEEALKSKLSEFRMSL